MGIVACYDMHLYCDHPDCRRKFDYGNPIQFMGYDRNSTLRKARKAGWLIAMNGESIENGNGAGRCFCPTHSGKKIKKESQSE